MIRRFGIVFLWFSCLAFLLGSAVFFTKPTINADMFSLLPKSHSKIAYAEDIFFKQNATRIMFSFTGENKDLAHDELIAWLKTQNIKYTIEIPSIVTLADVFSDYKYALLSEHYKAQLVDKARFEFFYLSELNQLGNPFVSATLSKDITLSLAAFIADNLKQSQVFTLKNNRITRRFNQKDYNLIIASIPSNNLAIDNAILLAEKIKHKLLGLTNNYPKTTISYSGNLFHTAQNAKQAKYEMSVFGSLSAVVLLFMVFWVFRAFSSILLASLTVLSALMGGAIAMVFIFNTIHLLTLVFAVTLIGIAIDYAFHVMSDLASANASSKTIKISQGTKTALLLSFITTGLGYSCLFGAPILLLSQVAVFVIAGLATAWLFTLLVVPIWSFSLSTSSLSKSERVMGVFTFLNQYKLRVFVVLCAGLICLFSVKPAVLNSDIRLLNASSKELMLNEKKHLMLLGQLESHIVFLFAENVEQLLQNQEKLINSLQIINPNIQHNAISRWLPSQQMQKNNLHLFSQAFNNKVLAISEELSGESVTLDGLHFMTYKDLQLTDFATLLNTQMFVQPTLAGTWLSVSGISDTELAKSITAFNNVFIYNKPKQISDLLEEYSYYLLYTLAAAVIICFILFSWKFSLKIASVQSLILITSVLSILWLCNFVQGSLSIFNLLGTLLIIGLAIDYLAFYQINRLTSVNVLAISLSAASSMCVFGMLAFSKTPAIFSFGLTVMIGILVVYILSPLSILKPEKE